MALCKEQMKQIYLQMWKIRLFEKSAERMMADMTIRGFAHLYIGEEAVATSVCAALREDDFITSTHRGHGHCIAKGADLKLMMSELCGRAAGFCKGKGGSMHIADRSLGILGANGIVGAGMPIATGAGLSAQIRGTDQVCVCFFGDGASNQGTFHESLNLASIWKLPVIFVCENNLYQISVPFKYHTNIDNIADRAVGYGIPGEVVDGNDVLAVYDAAERAIARARAGEGPTLIECKTYRHGGHFNGDPAVYRPKEEVEAWLKKDPIPRFRTVLLEQGVCTEEELTAIEQQAEAMLNEAVEFALAQPVASIEETLRDVYTDIVEEGRDR